MRRAKREGAPEVTRRKAAVHANHERWLVSYADFITLLFAFFVVMFASTQSDKNKAKDVSDSVRQALEHGQFSAAISTVLGRGKHESQKAPLSKRSYPGPGESRASAHSGHILRIWPNRSIRCKRGSIRT